VPGNRDWRDRLLRESSSPLPSFRRSGQSRLRLQSALPGEKIAEIRAVGSCGGSGGSGRPGRFPAPAPHRSGRAQFRHPALQAMNSPVTSRSRPCDAIRRRRVEMGSGPGVPGICPSGGLMARRLLPSTGSLGSVPPLQRYYSTLRLPSARPAALRCLRLAVSRSHPRFAPPAAGCAGRGPGVGHPVLPPGLAEKVKGPPRFLGDLRERALFSDPGGTAGARPLRRRDTAFR
jgi:hypothetical protein